MCKKLADLNNPDRLSALKALIENKHSLYQIYRQYYHYYQAILESCPSEGIALEIGSGAGFAKKIIPNLITSDYLPYEGIDTVIDATQLPYEANSLRFIGMMNVLHHIARPEQFFQEAERVLVSGGKIAIIDQHHGWLSRWILSYLHHEPYLPKAPRWEFNSTGPLSGANGALAWIIFKRDREKFNAAFPNLSLIRYEPHSPLSYWLSGGLKSWSLLPSWGVKIALKFDHFLIGLSKQFGSFVNIEIVKK